MSPWNILMKMSSFKIFYRKKALLRSVSVLRWFSIVQVGLESIYFLLKQFSPFFVHNLSQSLWMRMKIFSAFWFYPIFGLKQKPNIIFLLVDDLESELTKENYYIYILVSLEIWIATKWKIPLTQLRLVRCWLE